MSHQPDPPRAEPPSADDAASDPKIAAAIAAAFGGVPPDKIEPLRGGRSPATMLKVTVGGRAYALRQMKGPPPLHDPARQFACLSIAAGAGVGPRVVYANVETGVCIVDFVETAPKNEIMATRAGLEELALLLRKLHGAPPFPRFVSIPEAIGMVASSLAQQGDGAAFAGDLTGRVAEIAAALAPHVVETPVHLDPNPGNLLYDGQRFWLIDWELAGMGDPYQDLAALGLFWRAAFERREEMLAAYLGRAPGPRERAHFHLARGLVLVFYALVFRGATLGRGAPSAAPSAPLPDLSTVLGRLSAQNSSALDDPSFPWVLAEEARRTWSGAAFDEALAALR